ncbi:MAG: hypothetical protein Q7I99_06030 [Acholeplasmataceae bacterium]|nr:hypothetical protein [Acholeplasmataceae bacterium]
MKTRIDIFRGDLEISSVIAKSFFTPYRYHILSDQDNLRVEGSILRSQFSILEENKVVLSIHKDPDKKYFRLIDVDETHTNYLIMLMFSLISAVESNESSGE